MLHNPSCTGSGTFELAPYFLARHGHPTDPDMGGLIMPGPAPKPEHLRRRRNATVPMTHLPAEGRQGPVPEWPLRDDITASVKLDMARDRAEAIVIELDECDDGRTRRRLQREHDTVTQQATVLERTIEAQREMELQLWKELWSTPQAVVWDKLAFNREVAQYVRWKVLGELGDLNAAKEARAWSDRLGLHPLAMLRMRMEIDAPDESAAPVAPRPAPRKRTAASKAPADPRQVLRLVE